MNIKYNVQVEVNEAQFRFILQNFANLFARRVHNDLEGQKFYIKSFATDDNFNAKLSEEIQKLK